jgi:ATP/maltotriose-dependent transcriptional regulator MalT
MQSGDEAAVGEHLKSWIADARSREEGVEAVALRVYADWRLQRGEWRASLDPIQRGMALARQAHLQLDLTMAFSITSTVAMAQGSIADRVTGRRGDPDVAGMRRLLRRSPRWDARVEAAQGWSALARGDRGGARSRFAAGVELALARRQVFDAWLILGQQARALGDTAAATEAVTLARAHGLHLAAPRSA